MVEIHARSASRASARSPISRSRLRTRCASCAAAFSVNVIARIASTGTPSATAACTNRSTSTEVLPVPAPARTSSEPSRRSTASRCSSVSSTGFMRSTRLGRVRTTHSSRLGPANRRVRAAAAPGAAVGAGPELAAPHCPRRLSHELEGAGHPLFELLALLDVLLVEVAAELVAHLRRKETARPALLSPEGHVDAARGLEAEQLLGHVQVKRCLE